VKKRIIYVLCEKLGEETELLAAFYSREEANEYKDALSEETGSVSITNYFINDVDLFG
jgi:hypothetical protein